MRWVSLQMNTDGVAELMFFFWEDRLSTFYILLLLAIIDWEKTHVDCLNKGKHYFATRRFFGSHSIQKITVLI